MIEQLFPNWTHRRHRLKWERQWANPQYSPFWKIERPQKEFVEAIESDWLNKNQRVLDVGCENGDVSRLLSTQDIAATGVDYKAAAIENLQAPSHGRARPLKFEVVDLCSTESRMEPAGHLLDRGCFHRIAESFGPVYAQNVAHTARPGGHFSPPSGTFQDARFANYSRTGSEPELRQHVESTSGDCFTGDRAEPAVINASQDQEAMPALAFWMTRKANAPVPA